MIPVESKVYAMIQQFIEDNKISCAEDVYQHGHVIENAYDFIHDLCEAVGYWNDPVTDWEAEGGLVVERD